MRFGDRNLFVVGSLKSKNKIQLIPFESICDAKVRDVIPLKTWACCPFEIFHSKWPWHQKYYSSVTRSSLIDRSLQTEHPSNAFLISLQYSTFTLICDDAVIEDDDWDGKYEQPFQGNKYLWHIKWIFECGERVWSILLSCLRIQSTLLQFIEYVKTLYKKLVFSQNGNFGNIKSSRSSTAVIAISPGAVVWSAHKI